MKNDPLQNELRRLLAHLPDAPLSSNFTARVMQAVEREETRSPRRYFFPSGTWRALLPRAAVAAVVLGLAGFAFQRHELSSRRIALAQSVAIVAQAPKPPSVEALKNFDAIRRMSHPAHADTELLALLQ
jgi:hypothetical protein